jgi:hypothetical protein
VGNPKEFGQQLTYTLDTLPLACFTKAQKQAAIYAVLSQSVYSKASNQDLSSCQLHPLTKQHTTPRIHTTNTLPHSQDNLQYETT